MNKKQKRICVICCAMLAAMLISVLAGAIVWIATGNGTGLIQELLQPKPQTEQEYLDSIIDHDGVNRPTIEQFDRVKEGMTLEEAIELVGKPVGYTIYYGHYDFYWITDKDYAISMGIDFEDENADELSRWERAIITRILK